MAATKQPSTFLLLALVTLSSVINSSFAADTCAGAGTISVYWGQKSNDQEESTLQKTCATGNYNIVILESLIVFDNGSTPELNLAAHCGGSSNPCTELQSQIEYCQNKKIKVFLSIGQDHTSPSKTNIASSSEDVAKDLADYLLEHYLSGQPGPLGNVTLDGIDIADVSDTENLHWDDLVKAISALSTTSKKIYLSASPQCVYPDYYLGDAIATGLFDYIWVEFFYQNPSCIYSDGNSANLLSAWNKWTSNVRNSTIFLGLAASEDAAAGYIPPDALKSDVLPTAKQASNYGGVMIWDRYYDIQNNYSAQIKDSVGKECRCVCDDSAWTSFYGLRPGSLTM